MLSNYAAEVEWVCSSDGVPVVQNRTGRWFHVDSLPESAEPHDPLALSVKAWMEQQRAVPAFVSLRDAATDMLTHHVTGHPESQCPFAKQLREALLP